MTDAVEPAAGASRTSSIGCATTRKAITIAVSAAMMIPARIGKEMVSDEQHAYGHSKQLL